MPNHCENDLHITGPADQVAALLAHIGADQTPPKFDFDTLIPYPSPFREMDAEYEIISRAGDAAGDAATGGWPAMDDPDAAQKRVVYRKAQQSAMVSLAQQYRKKWNTDRDGFNSGGYEWRIRHWGTKWGAYDVARRDYDGDVIVTFQTAWSPPALALISALHRLFPQCNLELEYFERGMGYCGGASWWSAEWHDSEDGTPWEAGKVSNEWRSEEYRGCRGG